MLSVFWVGTFRNMEACLVTKTVRLQEVQAVPVFCNVSHRYCHFSWRYEFSVVIRVAILLRGILSVSFPYRYWPLPVGIKLGRVSKPSEPYLLHRCLVCGRSPVCSPVVTEILLQRWVFLYDVRGFAKYWPYEMCCSKFSWNFLIYKYVKSFRASGFISYMKRTRRRHGLAEEKLDESGAR